MRPLFGRAPQLALARHAVARAASGSGGLLLLTGEPGIGKTRLATEIAQLASDAGARVAWGRCWEAGGAPAFWPWIEIFRELDVDDHNLERADHAHGSDHEARFRALDLAADKLARHAKLGWLTLILDDLHAADASSLLLLMLLARKLPRLPLLVIGTHREAEVRSHRERAELLAKIAREADVQPLERLSRDEVVGWLREALPDAAPVAIDDIQRLTEGNPLFVHELLRLGPDAAGQRLPEGLTAILDQHLARLAPSTRDLLRRASVLGRELSTREIAHLLACDPHAIETQLEEARVQGILEASDSTRWAFSHVLLRDRLYAELDPQERATLHWQLGERMLAEPIASGRHPYTAAHHLLQGAAAGDPRRAAEVAAVAARHALTRLAFEDAAHIAERALQLLSDEHDELAKELPLLVAESLMRAGSTERAKQTCAAIADAARVSGHAETLARAALIFATNLDSANVDATMVALLGAALDALPVGDSPLRARVTARYAAARVPPATPEVAEQVLALAREARAMAARLDDPTTQLYVLQFCASAAGYMIGSEERFSMASDIMTLALALDDRVTLVIVSGWYIASLLECGQRADAEAALRAFEALMEGFPQPHYRWRLSIARALFPALDGDFETATKLGDEALALALEGGALPGRVAWAIQRIALAHASGEPRAVEPDLDRLLAITERVPPLRPYRAWILAAAGRTREARELLVAVEQAPHGYPWLVSAGDTAVMLEDAELAAALYPALAAERFRNRFFWGPAGAFAFGPTARILGNMARLLGRLDEARAHYLESLDLCERCGAKPLAALTRRALAELEGANGRADAVVRDASPASTQPTLSLTRDGELWSLDSSTGPTVRLKHSKGLVYLSHLLGQPGTPIHVLELVGAGERAADAGPVLDEQAKHAYRRRLEDLASELDEAESFGDGARACRAREEIDALAEQLAGAVGLGGRDRRAASNVERARINVQRRLKDCLGRIAAADAPLGRHLADSVKTGTFCRYQPR